MDSIKMILFGIVVGMRDSILGIAAIYHLDKARREEDQVAKTNSQQPETVLSRRRRAQAGFMKPNNRREEPRVIHRILQCSGLNGGVFGMSIAAFHYIFLPGLEELMKILFGGTPGLASRVWYFMQPVLLTTFGALWVLPLFVLSRIVNSLWFQDIADSAYRHLQGRPQPSTSISKLVADTLFSILIQILFLIQSMLVSRLPIPPIGEVASILHLSLLYSLYAFEYKWCNMGWVLHRRLSYLEHNWPYFVGFGMPLAVLTSLSSTIVISGCIFSILFPLFILSANQATPMTGTCEYPLQLFSGVVYVSNTIFHRTVRPNMLTSSPVHPINTPPLTPTHEPLVTRNRHRAGLPMSSSSRRNKERIPGKRSSNQPEN